MENYSYYRINVSKNGLHLFTTTDIQSKRDHREALKAIKEKFPAHEGYLVRAIGRVDYCRELNEEQ